MTDRPRFHLAFPVHDLHGARAFYGGVLGCPEGRSSDEWVDFAHLTPSQPALEGLNEVDGKEVPVRHFGVIVTPSKFKEIAEKLRVAGTRFLIEPQTRFQGLPGEQLTLFVADPSGNALEFKAFADDRMVFAKD
jgi:extradiol dioxygenase family protein